MNDLQDIGKGVTLFTVERDDIGWKAVVRRDDKVIKERYAPGDSREVADSYRTQFINQFWGNQLN